MPVAFVGGVQPCGFDGLRQIGERVHHQGNVTLLLEDLGRKAVFDGPNGQVGVEPDTRNDGKHGQRESDSRPGHIEAARRFHGGLRALSAQEAMTMNMVDQSIRPASR